MKNTFKTISTKKINKIMTTGYNPNSEYWNRVFIDDKGDCYFLNAFQITKVSAFLVDLNDPNLKSVFIKIIDEFIGIIEFREIDPIVFGIKHNLPQLFTRKLIGQNPVLSEKSAVKINQHTVHITINHQSHPFFQHFQHREPLKIFKVTKCNRL